MQEAGRLLPCGMDKWVHVNCAIWSAEVYEEHSGLLGMVHTAINRGAQLVSGENGPRGGGGGGGGDRWKKKWCSTLLVQRQVHVHFVYKNVCTCTLNSILNLLYPHTCTCT